MLVATATVLAMNRLGTFVSCRALLDSGSQLHLIHPYLHISFNLRRRNRSTGVGDFSFDTHGSSLNISMWTQTSKCSTDITYVIVSNITSCQRKQNIRNRYTNKSTFYFSKKSNKKLFSWFDIWKHVADVAANSWSDDFLVQVVYLAKTMDSFGGFLWFFFYYDTCVDCHIKSSMIWIFRLSKMCYTGQKHTFRVVARHAPFYHVANTSFLAL